MTLVSSPDNKHDLFKMQFSAHGCKCKRPRSDLEEWSVSEDRQEGMGELGMLAERGWQSLHKYVTRSMHKQDQKAECRFKEPTVTVEPQGTVVRMGSAIGAVWGRWILL